MPAPRVQSDAGQVDSAMERLFGIAEAAGQDVGSWVDEQAQQAVLAGRSQGERLQEQVDTALEVQRQLVESVRQGIAGPVDRGIARIGGLVGGLPLVGESTLGPAIPGRPVAPGAAPGLQGPGTPPLVPGSPGEQPCPAIPAPPEPVPACPSGATGPGKAEDEPCVAGPPAPEPGDPVTIGPECHVQPVAFGGPIAEGAMAPLVFLNTKSDLLNDVIDKNRAYFGSLWDSVKGYATLDDLIDSLAYSPASRGGP